MSRNPLRTTYYQSFEMKLSDYLGYALAVEFGLWLAVFPASVIDFYTWFHKGRVRMPGAFAVRLTGALWILLVTICLSLRIHKALIVSQMHRGLDRC